MQQEMKQIAARNRNNPSGMFEEFFAFYEPIYFAHQSFNEGLNAFPSPLKEIVAAHQAWGMIGSDGFDNYFFEVDEAFDKEVQSGLGLIGKESCYIALEEARALFREKKEIPKAEEERLWVAFYEPIREFEAFAGEFLLRRYGSI